MFWHFTYRWGDKSLVKQCFTLREAEIFFDILISAKCEYICVKTCKKRGDTNYDKN